MDWSAALKEKARRMEAEFARRVVGLPGGARLSVRERPAGDEPALTVVLLHGISSSAASWFDVSQALPRDWRVLAWDAPGYGLSTALPQAHPRDADYALRLHEWLGQDAAGRILLVGHSLGALMALAYAARALPQTLAAVLLLSPAAGYGGREAQARERVRAERNAGLDGQGVAGLAQRIDQRLISAGGDAQAREWVRWITAQMHAEGYRQAIDMLCDSDLGGHAPPAAPLAIACGEHDVVTPPPACRRWAEVLRASYADIPGAGHASPSERPDAVVQWMEETVFKLCGLP